MRCKVRLLLRHSTMSKQAGIFTAAAATVEGLEGGGQQFIILVRQLLVSLHVQARMSVKICWHTFSSRCVLMMVDMVQSASLARAS